MAGDDHAPGKDARLDDEFAQAAIAGQQAQQLEAVEVRIEDVLRSPASGTPRTRANPRPR